MRCPYCENSLTFIQYELSNLVQVYECQNCGKKYERHTFYDRIGLVRDDKIYELTKNGKILRGW